MSTDEPLPAAGWILRTLLVFLSLASTGCQVQGTLPAGASGSPPAPRVTLALLGDVMPGRDVRPGPQSLDYLEPFLVSADLALANLESPLTDAPPETDSPYALCAPPHNARYLVEAGFDLLALANNHHLDCGIRGLADTQAVLGENGLGFLGPGPEPLYRSVHGVALAFLAFDATASFDIETAVQAVRSARQAGSLVIVSMHWGAEYQGGASPAQERIAEHLAAAGAALIWGHHPHVLQPSEWIADGRTLVLYSLGNALFDQAGLADTRRSALVLVKLDAHGVEEFQAVPFVIDVRGSRIAAPLEEDREIVMRYFE